MMMVIYVCDWRSRFEKYKLIVKNDMTIDACNRPVMTNSRHQKHAYLKMQIGLDDDISLTKLCNRTQKMTKTKRMKMHTKSCHCK
jgi:hypothetical protein